VGITASGLVVTSKLWQQSINASEDYKEGLDGEDYHID
jgi:hypothetical protein